MSQPGNSQANRKRCTQIMLLWGYTKLIKKIGLQFSLNCYEKLIWPYQAEIIQDTFIIIFFNNRLLAGTLEKTVNCLSITQIRKWKGNFMYNQLCYRNTAILL